MASSPGHQKWPDHRIVEEHPSDRVTVMFGGEKIAESTSAIKVVEDRHPPRYYLPREDVDMGVLERSVTTSYCPFKGTASYYSIHIGDRRVDDVVWSYEDPYDEHIDLKGKMVFYEEKIDSLKVSVARIVK